MSEPTPPADPTPPAAGQPRQVGRIASEHLLRVGRACSNRFRLIMDDPERKGKPGWPVIDLAGPFEQHAQEMRRRNDMGYGVFYMANRAEGGQKAQHVVEANCFFADFDGTPLENVERLGLKPHVTVETSPGKRHFYWRIEGIPIADFGAVQERLIAVLGSDKSIKDLPRVMRLPGFLHMKNPEAPHLVTIVDKIDKVPYAYAAFVEALAAAEKAAGIGADKPNPKPRKLPTSIGPMSADLARAESALRHSIAADQLNLSERSQWVRLGIALKASYGEDGFPLWVQLSSEADGFESEEDCRKQWGTFKDDRSADKQLTIATFIKNAQQAGWSAAAHDGATRRDVVVSAEHDRRVDASVEPKPAGDPIDPRDTGDGGGSGGGGGKGKPDAATVIVGQAEDAGDEHFLSPDGLAYVTYGRTRADGTTHRATVRLDGSAYRGVLLLRYHEEAVNKTAAREQVASAVALMEARARAANVRHAVHLRYAHHAGRVYVNVDPDEGVVVEIDASPEEWRYVQAPPVRFVAGSRGPLATPQRGGTLAMFQRHYNVSGEDLVRTIGFMLGASQTADAYPVLIAVSEAGAAKSNYGDKVLALTDPPRGKRKAARFNISTEERNLHVQANRSSVLFMDNISSFTAEVADQLCRLSTGAASSYRMHNTMDEEQQFALARPVVVTCITIPTTRTDLLSRALRVTVQRTEQRRTEEAVWRDFAADEGMLLGFLFSCVSTILRDRAGVAAAAEAGTLHLPRMADFAQWVEGAAGKLGLQPGAFAQLLCDEQAAMQADAAQRDPVVEGLVRYCAAPGATPFAGSARALRDLLAARDPGRDLPHHNQIQARITRNAQGLRELGVDVTVRYDSHAKGYRFHVAPLPKAGGVEGVEPRPEATRDEPDGGELPF